jgi:hypothetical protein
MAHFLKSGNTYKVFPGNALDISENLPAGNYTLKFNPMEGFYLEEVEEFRMPTKIYGDCLKNSQRILNTFKLRDGNTGVLLVGEKGSGKTLLARQISIESDLPVIIINSSFKGDGFNSFLSSITQPCVIFLDEFEKVYDRDHQEQMLTLLDGTYQSKKLFLLTSNDKYRIDVNMRNRPGRIFYLIEFGGLEEDFIREYCRDNLNNSSYVSDIIRLSRIFDVFSFDLLSSLVEESNRYGENPKDLVSILNAKPEYGGEIDYSVSAYIIDTQVPPGSISPNSIQMNTTSHCIEVDIWFAVRRDKDEDNKISSVLESQEEIDWDAIQDMLKSGNVVFYNRSKMMSRYNPFGGNVKFSTHSVEVECYPNDITNYTAKGGIVYRPEDGFSIVLEKSGKSTGFQRPRL